MGKHQKFFNYYVIPHTLLGYKVMCCVVFIDLSILIEAMFRDVELADSDYLGHIATRPLHLT